MSTMRRFVKSYGLFGLWLVTAGLMCHDYLHDPPDPNRTGTAAYGHNGDGVLLNMLALTAVELIVLYLILQPWSYRRSWWRPLLALVLLVPWTLLSMVASMHAGGVAILHWMWLFVASIIMAAWMLVSLVAWVKDRRADGGGGRT